MAKVCFKNILTILENNRKIDKCGNNYITNSIKFKVKFSSIVGYTNIKDSFLPLMKKLPRYSGV